MEALHSPISVAILRIGPIMKPRVRRPGILEAQRASKNLSIAELPFDTVICEANLFNRPFSLEIANRGSGVDHTWEFILREIS